MQNAEKALKSRQQSSTGSVLTLVLKQCPFTLWKSISRASLRSKTNCAPAWRPWHCIRFLLCNYSSCRWLFLRHSSTWLYGKYAFRITERLTPWDTFCKHKPLPFRSSIEDGTQRAGGFGCLAALKNIESLWSSKKHQEKGEKAAGKMRFLHCISTAVLTYGKDDFLHCAERALKCSPRICWCAKPCPNLRNMMTTKACKQAQGKSVGGMVGQSTLGKFYCKASNQICGVLICKS